MAKVPKTYSSSAIRPLHTSGARWVLAVGAALLLVGLVLAGPACRPPVPDAPPKPSKLAVLVCADSDHELFEDLKAKFSRLDVSKVAETPECQRAKAAASEVGHTCLEDEASCTTPHFVDGKPTDTPTSVYDYVILFPQLLHGSLSVKQVTTTRSVNNDGVSSSLGGPNARQAPGARGTTVTDRQVINSAETDYTGEVFLFEPVPGQLRPGKQFKNIAPEPLRDLLQELLRR